jgi:hypothetical protein
LIASENLTLRQIIRHLCYNSTSISYINFFADIVLKVSAACYSNAQGNLVGRPTPLNSMNRIQKIIQKSSIQESLSPLSFVKLMPHHLLTLVYIYIVQLIKTDTTIQRQLFKSIITYQMQKYLIHGNLYLSWIMTSSYFFFLNH